MKKIFISLLLFLYSIQNDFAQFANAGEDHTIYLTQTSTTILDGSRSSGSFFHWTDISTDYFSRGVIISPNSKTTYITGLEQGVFYYQLAVKKGRNTVFDTVVIRVDYDIPPSNANYVRHLSLDKIRSVVNGKNGLESYNESKANVDGEVFFERGRFTNEYVDRMGGKFYSTVEDGFGWNGNNYSRSEIHYGSFYGLDTAKTYLFEWKGYFPQPYSEIKRGSDVTVIWQLHSLDDYSPPFEFTANGDGNIYWVECTAPYNKRTVTAKIADYSQFYNQTHTIRIIIKEGLAGSGAFVKVLVDGVQKYIRDTGDIGRTWNKDYPKFGTVYDWGRAVVDPGKRGRAKKFSLVTEMFNIYILNSKTGKPSDLTGNE